MEQRADVTLHAAASSAEAAERAAGVAQRENEEFRREQLTKLDDLVTSHRLLGDRQRQSEDQLTRRIASVEERTNNRTTALRKELDSVRTRLCELEQPLTRLLEEQMQLGRRVTRISWVLAIPVTLAVLGTTLAGAALLLR